jgi:hypothetical protein
MSHQIFGSRFRDHPRICLNISAGARPIHSGDIDAAVDSDAKANLWSLEEYLDAGFLRRNLSHVVFDINAANKSQIPIEGAFLGQIQAKALDGSPIVTRTMTYVSSAVKRFYLSFNTMLDLGIVSHNFPTAGSAHDVKKLPGQLEYPAAAVSLTNLDTTASPNAPEPETVTTNAPSIAAIRALDAGCTTAKEDGVACDCPQRKSVPIRPADLLFPCTPENNDKMKAWLLQHYASSTFNTCPHRPLACMAGPPVEMHLDPSAAMCLPHRGHNPSSLASASL